jgi:hypothetical protein
MFKRTLFLRLLGSVAFLLLDITAAQAQYYRQLTIDFRSVPQSNTNVVAYTNCSIDFSYVAHHENDYYILDFNIALKVNNNKSWMDTRRITSADMLAEILKHEQGHYIIAYMEQQELLRTVSKTVFYASYQNQAREIFDRIDAKYKKLNVSYDVATQHMVNRPEQQSWDAYFKKQLEYMPPLG